VEVDGAAAVVDAKVAKSMSNGAPPPVVSVIVLTYNHAAFITAALESVLMQVDAPPHEVLVADDCSTDGARDCIAQAAAAHPGRLRLLDRPRNLGLSDNLQDAWRQSRGKYIALLEGDDRWIDPRKLAKVTAALEAHPEWTGCFHAVRPEGPPGRALPERLPADFSRESVHFEELIRRVVHVPTYSAVTYRRGIVPEFPAWHRRVACGDWGLHVLHAEHGPLGFLPDVMTAYRIHEGGLWSSMDEVRRWQQTLSLWAALDVHYAGRYWQVIEEARNAFVVETQATLANLRKIERRYHTLGLHRVASAIKRLKEWFRRGPAEHS
jgi:glycosyltransferase involved in cell wall biosynthesis